MYKYERNHVEAVIMEMSSMADGRLSCLDSEIQDAGEFLLVTAQVKEGMSQDEIIRVRDEMAELCASRFPDRYGDYSWMIVLQRGEEIVDTAFSKLLV